jgi:two-component system, OmpR family, phosphate regulon response regulator PhoB
MDLQINEYIKSQRAMVVEDDVAIAQLLKIHLTQLGFQVDVQHDADKAEKALVAQPYALCLLDWMLPTTQGIDFLKANRSKLQGTMIMMVTAKADADSIVSGLEFGADDYLTKPFDAKVLVARVRQLMRRRMNEEKLQKAAQGSAEEATQAELSFDGLSVDVAKHIVTLNNVEVHLTPSEFKLLAELFKARGQVLTRDRLIDLIQGQDVTVTGRTIDTHIFALRKKIGAWSKHIETIRGVGYRILISVQDSTEPDIQ